MKKTVIILAGLVFLLFQACAPQITLVDTSCPGYKSELFSRSNIETSGIAIMPVLGGDDKEQYRRPMGEALYNELSETFGKNNVIHSQSVIRVLNEHDLAEEYSSALRNYQHTGIISGTLINNVGNVLEVNYLLYTRLLAGQETAVIDVGEFRQRINIDELFVQSQIWDTSIGDVVWEGKGGVAANLKYSQPNIVELTAAGLAEVLGNDRNDGPCEDPRMIIKSAENAVSQTYLAAIFGSTILSLLIILAL